MKKFGWILVVILIAAGLVVVRMKRMNQKESAPLVKIVPPTVEVATVSEGQVVHSRHVLGRVIGSDEAAVAPRIMGQVLKVRVREGDTVKPGQVLVEIDPREIQDAVSQAEAGVAAAKEAVAATQTGYDTQHSATARDKILFEAKAIAAEQWDRSRAADQAAAARLEAARARLTVSEKQLDQAKTRLGYTRLQAPFSGVVSARLADPGALAVPGKPLVKLVHHSGVRVRAEVPPEDFSVLKIGQPLRLSLGDISISAQVSRVFPAMGASHLATFEADLSEPPPGFVSGATVGVDLELKGAEGVRVPADALLDGENGSFVFKLEGESIHPLKVDILARSMEDAVISGDLSVGDRVVVARPSRLMTLAEGMKVRVAPSAD